MGTDIGVEKAVKLSTNVEPTKRRIPMGQIAKFLDFAHFSFLISRIRFFFGFICFNCSCFLIRWCK